MATKTWSDVNSRSKRAMVTNNESRCLSVKASPAASVVAMNPHFSVEQPGLGRRRLAHRPRWPIHFIPTCSSWLNQIERFFALSTDKAIRRGSFAKARPHADPWLPDLDDIQSASDNSSPETTNVR